MKFILAPDSFKESMSSKEACDAMERGIKKIIPEAECIKVPMADGGEGTVEALIGATNGTFHKVNVIAPLGNKVEAVFGILGNKKTAVIEMASASGIQLVKPINDSYGISFNLSFISIFMLPPVAWKKLPCGR